MTTKEMQRRLNRAKAVAFVRRTLGGHEVTTRIDKDELARHLGIPAENISEVWSLTYIVHN